MQMHLSNHDRQSPRGPHYPTSSPKVQLEIVRGQARHKIRPVDVPVFLIGTAEDCDMVLGDFQFPESIHVLVANGRRCDVTLVGSRTTSDRRWAAGRDDAVATRRLHSYRPIRIPRPHSAASGNEIRPHCTLATNRTRRAADRLARRIAYRAELA